MLFSLRFGSLCSGAATSLTFERSSSKTADTRNLNKIRKGSKELSHENLMCLNLSPLMESYKRQAGQRKIPVAASSMAGG